MHSGNQRRNLSSNFLLQSKKGFQQEGIFNNKKAMLL